MPQVKFLALLTLLAVNAGCGQDDASENNAKRKRVKKDRGEASMMLGDLAWQATSARARLEDGELKISCSRTDGSYQTSVVRQSLSLNIKDFNGPGEYKAVTGSGGMSNFVVVGLNTGAEDDSGIEQAAIDALSEAKFIRLDGAVIDITSADDKQIEGTFSYERGNPAITNGTFRATIRSDD